MLNINKLPPNVSCKCACGCRQDEECSGVMGGNGCGPGCTKCHCVVNGCPCVNDNDEEVEKDD